MGDDERGQVLLKKEETVKLTLLVKQLPETVRKSRLAKVFDMAVSQIEKEFKDKKYSADISAIKAYKKTFIEKTNDVLSLGLTKAYKTGEEAKKDKRQLSFGLKVGNKAIAESLLRALDAEFGLKEPKNIYLEKPFEDAEISKDRYPLTFKRDNNTIIVSWPWWIVPGTSREREEKIDEGHADLKSMVPRKLV